MEKRNIAFTLVLVVIVVGLLSAPTVVRPSAGSAAPSSVRLVGFAHGSVPHAAAHAVVTPMTGFARTVLVETFTGVWCVHCPSESQALYKIDHNSAPNVVAIAELHICALAPPNPCYENYVPPDGTTNSRGSFYNVCGFPDVFFDGGHDACGASDSEPQMENQYKMQIANASMFPGNVSITQTAKVSSTNVLVHEDIQSAIDGSYNTITYLLEYIGKRNISNGYGPHDIGWVVRSTMHNHPVTYTSGTTTSLDVSGAINSTWNDRNLSVITFVQNNSTKAVENANMALVTTLLTDVSASPTGLPAGNSSTITVRVTNSSTGAGVSGAAINLTSDIGGSITPGNGTTASDGTYTATFKAPKVTSTETAVITAQVTAANYTDGSGLTSLVVTPRFPPTVPTGLTIVPGNQQVALNWTPPASGGGGVTYHVYRATAPSGPYTPIDVSTSTQYVDTSMAIGSSYWYKVDALGAGGYSPNTTAIAASPITVTSQGLAPSEGWWISIGTLNFTSPTFASISLYLPDGFFAYQFGSDSYAYVAPDPFGSLTVSGAPQSISAAFSPRYATLQGTVSPATATLTLDGNAIPVSGGSFLQLVEAGDYSLVVTSTGYVTNTTAVSLTPGNTTTLDFHLVRADTGGGLTSANGGFTGNQLIIIVAVAAVIGVAAILGGIMLMTKKSKGTPPPRARRAGPRAPPEEEA